LEKDFIRIATFPPHGLYFSLGILFRFLFKKLDDARFVVSFSKAHWINWIPFIILKKLRNLKYVVVIHSGDIGTWSDTPIHRALLKNAHTLFGVSETICEAYSTRLEKPVIYLPPFIPFKKEPSEKSACREKLGIDQDKKVILFVGSLRKVKRPDIPLAALESLGLEFLQREKILLVFVGGGELRQQLEANAKTRNIEKFVLFAGIQPRERIPVYLKASDLYLICSDYEGQPLALLEALLYPVEIIGSDAAGIRSVLEGFEGNIFERGNTDALASLLKTVLTDPNYKPKFAHANNYFSNNFDYQQVVNTFVGQAR
jgi:glycosyltransferase involved in cell wall biosynthesis